MNTDLLCLHTRPCTTAPIAKRRLAPTFFFALIVCVAAPHTGFSLEPATGKTTQARSVSENLAGDWICNGDVNDIYSIGKNRKVSHRADKGTWRFSNGTLELRWDNGFRTVFEIGEIGDELIGRSYPPQRPDSPDRMVFQRVVQRPVGQPAAAVQPIFPAKREITDSTGRKMQVTILSRTADAIRIRRNGDGREFEIPIARLSEDDRKFLDSLGKPGEIVTSKFRIEFNGEPIEVTRVGSGPVGVLLFGSTSNIIKRVIPEEQEKFRGLLPDRISFFLWDYPSGGAFREIGTALAAYEDGDEKKIRPDFTGVATGVLAEVRQKTGLKDFILVGNSLGVGVILWDYKPLVADPSVRFLLVSPTEAFMPPVSTLGKLERTMLLASHGDDPENGGEIDGWLKGREARRWVESNLDRKTLRRISTEPRTGPMVRDQQPPEDPLKVDFSKGHIIVGHHLKCELFAELLRMHAGL